MKLSPLQLESYFLTELNCRANQDHKTDKEIKFNENDLLVTAEVTPINDQSRRWQVSVNIKLQPPPDANSPYYLCINLLGFIWVAPELPQEKLEALVRTNGPSMLYGAAREMVRDVTARGPFSALMLPSVSFIPDSAGQAGAKAPSGETETREMGTKSSLPKVETKK